MFNNKNIRYFIATLCVIVFTISLDLRYFKADKSTKAPAELAQEKPLEKESHKEAFHKPADHKSAEHKSSEHKPSLKMLSSAVLPPVPVRYMSASPVDEKTLMSANENKPAKMFPVDTQTHSPKNKQTSLIDNKTNSDKLITQHLNNMRNLNAKQLQLAFPASSIATQRILKYMHQCIGIDIGALKGDGLIRLSHKVKQQSNILRLASGAKTPYEQALLNAYAKNLDMVRIYPHWFDETFAKYIASTLGNTPLSQLSGEYKLIGQTLSLDHIVINDQVLKGSWRLSNVQVCS